ncbi:MAG: hypothetical protein U0610_29715 [bacterium]
MISQIAVSALDVADLRTFAWDVATSATMTENADLSRLALAAIEELTARGASGPVDVYLLGSLLARLGNAEGAVGRMEAIAATHPASPEYKAVIGNLYEELGDWERAFRWWEAATADAGSGWTATDWLEWGTWERKAAYWGQAQELVPARACLAEARRLFLRSQGNTPDAARAWNSRIAVQSELRNVADAIGSDET